MLAQKLVMIEVALDELAHVLAGLLLGSVHGRRADAEIRQQWRRGAVPCILRTSSRCFWIAGMRIGQGRSANITMRAFSFAADTTESSDDATA